VPAPSPIPFFDEDPVLSPSVSSAETTPPIVNQFGLDTVLIDGYPIDAVVSEKHDFDLDVTEYPVERGADITDHVRPKPLKITLDCFVSDAPFGPIASHQTRKNGTPSSDAYDRLKQLRDRPELITVVTSLRTYDSMVLSKVSFPRNSGEPVGLRFTCEFIKVLIVSDIRVSVAAAVTKKSFIIGPSSVVPDVGTPCYVQFIEATGSESQDRAATFGEALGNDGENYYFAIGAGPSPDSAATGVWINSVASPDVFNRNVNLIAQGLPPLHQGYNPYYSSADIDFIITGGTAGGGPPQPQYLTGRSNGPVTQSPGDVSQDAIDQAFSAPPPDSSGSGAEITPAGQALINQVSSQASP